MFSYKLDIIRFYYTVCMSQECIINTFTEEGCESLTRIWYVHMREMKKHNFGKFLTSESIFIVRQNSFIRCFLSAVSYTHLDVYKRQS